MARRPVVILSGPSGVGKDTVLEAWHAADSRIVRVVACTTREPRRGETDGVEYHFLSEAEFQRKVAEGAFLEHELVHRHWYGTPRSGLDALWALGAIPVLKIDVQGARDILPELPEAVTIFLLPPSDAELERRIRARGQNDEQEIAVRLSDARGEVAQAGWYQHRVVNGDLASTVRELTSIVR